MIRTRTVALVVGLLAWAHAVWLTGYSPELPGGDTAHYLAIAANIRNTLRGEHPGRVFGLLAQVIPNPSWTPAWMGLGMLAGGASERVGVAMLLPFHVLLVAGLWRGGRALGGSRGGGLAVALGTLAVGVVHVGRTAMLDFPLVACAAWAGALALEGRVRGVAAAVGIAGWTKLAALPSLAGLALEVAWWHRADRRALLAAVGIGGALAGLGYVGGIGALAGYATESGNVDPALRGAAGAAARIPLLVGAGFGALQPPLLLVAVVVLLAAPSREALRPLVWALGVGVGLLAFTLTPQARYLLPAVPFVAMAAAALVKEGAPRGGALAAGLAVLVAAGQLVAYDLGRSAALGGALFHRDLTLPAPAGGRVDTHLSAALHALDARVRERGAADRDGRARVALALPDQGDLSASVAMWIAARDDLAIELQSTRPGHPLVTDAPLTLVVRCPGPLGQPAGLPDTLPVADAREDWPRGCVAETWHTRLDGR